MDNFSGHRGFAHRNEEKHRLLGLRPAGSRPSAAPDRYAILPPGIPMMSRLRRHTLDNLGNMATVTLPSPAHRLEPALQMAFQKSQADEAALDPRGQGRRKRPGRGDFRATQRDPTRWTGFPVSELAMTLCGFPGHSRFFRREIRMPFKRTHALSKRPANSRSA